MTSCSARSRVSALRASSGSMPSPSSSSTHTAATPSARRRRHIDCVSSAPDSSSGAVSTGPERTSRATRVPGLRWREETSRIGGIVSVGDMIDAVGIVSVQRQAPPHGVADLDPMRGGVVVEAADADAVDAERGEQTAGGGAVDEGEQRGGRRAAGRDRVRSGRLAGEAAPGRPRRLPRRRRRRSAARPRRCASPRAPAAASAGQHADLVDVGADRISGFLEEHAGRAARAPSSCGRHRRKSADEKNDSMSRAHALPT